MGKNVYLIGIIILFSAFITNAALSDNILYARYPALSPDGKTIAFTYRGDIWTVPSEGGEALRLTVHEAEDIRPQFSPDGRMILFSSYRYDNYDIYVIPSGGGTSRQLTFHSGRDIGTGWFPQSDSILFTSSREGWRDIFKVSIDGGTPIRLTGYPYEQEYNGKISTDGRCLLFNNGSGLSRWWRRDLKASRNTDIFLQDRSQETFTSRRLTDFSGHDVWPILNEERREIYFVSCRGEWAQVWKIPIDGGETIQLTDFTGDGAQWLNSNPQGTMLVFEQGFHIWIMDPADGRPRRVDIQIQTDERKNLSEKKTFKGKVEWYSLSPDEKKIAAVIHGEIFVIPAKEPKEGIRVTFTSAREQTPVWGSDSKTLYYSSDRNGNYDIYSVDVTAREESRLTDSPENEVKPLVSPDGNYLVFYRGLDKIIRLDLGANKEVEWTGGMFFDLGVEPTIEYDWSPDSRWLAFTMAGPTYETDIYAVSLDGKSQNLSRFAEWNYRPRFSEDGKTVYFTSTFNDNYNTWKIDLIHKPPEFFEASFDSLFIEEPEEKEQSPKKDDKAEKEKPPITKIDFDRIEERLGKAYELSASSVYPALTPDGAKYLFISSVLEKSEIWSVNIKDEPELKQITKSGVDKKYLTITKDSKEVLYLEEGKIKRTEIETGNTTALSFTASLEIDVPKLNRQKFNESWQMLNTYFYDSAFHGADWAGARDKYEPVLDHVRTEPEFRNLIKEMIGELRASHLNIYPRPEEPNQNVQTGETGIMFDYRTLERDGRFLIADIVGKSTADLAGIKPGQYITAVNDKQLSPNDNIFKILAGTADKRLILAISDKPDKKGREFTLKPVTSITGEVYKDRVEKKRHLVDSLSGGRMAYIHIPAMSTKRLEAFKEELISIAEPKEALIIDVRDNGGGYIAVHLLGILVRTPYFLRNFRDSPVTSENKMRSKALEKPMALLINNYSASNSEIFAEGFRKLKLGKIIGEPTAGAVIGTSSYALIDGTRIRRPSWGAFTLEMEDTDIKPRYPDIFVENLPDDFINGRDPQLVRAVEELMKELK